MIEDTFFGYLAVGCSTFFSKTSGNFCSNLLQSAFMRHKTTSMWPKSQWKSHLTLKIHYIILRSIKEFTESSFIFRWFDCRLTTGTFPAIFQRLLWFLIFYEFCFMEILKENNQFNIAVNKICLTKMMCCQVS